MSKFFLEGGGGAYLPCTDFILRAVRFLDATFNAVANVFLLTFNKIED